MLRAGIVGFKNREKYIGALRNLNSCIYVGIYAPSFQIDLKLFNSIEQGVLSFENLVNQCDLIIFSAGDSIFYPLIKEAIRCSKAVFLDSVSKYTYEQINLLIKLSQEANIQIQVAHPNMYHDAMKLYLDKRTQPLMIESDVQIKFAENILKDVREEVSNVLFIVKSTIKKVGTNIVSSCSEIPDLYNLSIEFNNGCFCRILVSLIKLPVQKKVRIIGVNSNFELNFSKSESSFSINGVSKIKAYDFNSNSTEKLVTKQLGELYLHIMNSTFPEYSLDYELDASLVIEEVTRKLRVYMNIV